MRPTTWQPVLEGRSRQCAQETVSAIVDDLLKVADDQDDQLYEGSAQDPFVTILLAEAARDIDRPELATKALERLDRAITHLGNNVLPPRLFGGFCGVAWLATWLPRSLRDQRCEGGAMELDSDDGDPCVEIDATLMRGLANWDRDYDLISGLVGFGVYALERLPRANSETLLRLVIERLDATAQRVGDGITWFTPPEWLPALARAEAPAGCYNLGVAHGVPGIIGFLGHAFRAGCAVEKVRRLLDGAVAWLLTQQLPDGEGARYACLTIPGRTVRATRASWCHGGLGLSAALMIAGRCVRNPSWEKEAVRLALMESQRIGNRNSWDDACLCHGAAGNALLFQRFYASTGDQRFLVAAREWYARTLELRTLEGVGGYRFWGKRKAGDPNSERTFLDNASFLNGSAGVAMALLAATSRREPSWDRLLLSDIPTQV